MQEAKIASLQEEVAKKEQALAARTEELDSMKRKHASQEDQLLKTFLMLLDFFGPGFICKKETFQEDCQSLRVQLAEALAESVSLKNKLSTKEMDYTALQHECQLMMKKAGAE